MMQRLPFTYETLRLFPPLARSLTVSISRSSWSPLNWFSSCFSRLSSVDLIDSVGASVDPDAGVAAALWLFLWTLTIWIVSDSVPLLRSIHWFIILSSFTPLCLWRKECLGLPLRSRRRSISSIVYVIPWYDPIRGCIVGRFWFWSITPIQTVGSTERRSCRSIIYVTSCWSNSWLADHTDTELDFFRWRDDSTIDHRGHVDRLPNMSSRSKVEWKERWSSP